MKTTASLSRKSASTKNVSRDLDSPASTSTRLEIQRDSRHLTPTTSPTKSLKRL
ncbi:hypothetical protein KI387_001954, partial [Taxus chinensis]